MKKSKISLIMVICLIICMFPTAAFATASPEETVTEAYYKNYTAIGDSICAGFAQLDYEYVNGFNMDDNINSSPASCYARKVGDRTGSEVYNLGKCGCDSNELLDILTKGTYLEYLGKSDLITLEIGSNDLLMAVCDKILACAGTTMTHQQAMALVEPLLTRDIDGIVNVIKVITGIELTEDQIKAIMAELSDEALDKTLGDAYKKFTDNFPIIVDKLEKIKPTAELVILNYYNPFKNINISTTKIIQNYTNQMNTFTENHCTSVELKYVNISDIETNMDCGIPDPHPSEAGHTDIADRIIAALYTVTATAQTGGTITPSSENVVKCGSTLTFAIAAADGYTISDVKVDGESKGALTEYKFDKINEDHSISAEFSNGTTPSPSPTPTPPDKPYYNTYSALGDSITAGYAREHYTGDYSNPESGYVALAATQLGVKAENNNNLGLLGLDSGGLLNILTDKTNIYHDRFVNDLADSDLISIDIGSNDLTMALLNLIIECLDNKPSPEERINIIQRFAKNGVNLNTLENDLKKSLGPDVTDEEIKEILKVLNDNDIINKRLNQACEEFKVNWDAIINEIRNNINEDAAIVALGYYYITPEQQDEEIADPTRTYVAEMNKYISKDSKVVGEYVYVATTGVELISFGKITLDPHPSNKGHSQIADRLVDAVLNDITAVASDGVTVSPNGKKTVAYGLTDDYTYSYTFTPTAGNIIKEVYVDGEKVDAPDGAYTFKKVTGNHTIGVSAVVIPFVPSVTSNYYNVTTNASKGGTITSSANGSVMEGTNVTLTITPDPDCTIDYIELDGNRITNTNIITISNIARDHSIYVAFKDSNGENTLNNPFTDIKSTDWFYKEALYMYGHKIIKGTSETTFDPNVAVSRAMIVAILYRMENEPTGTNKGEYTDVAKDTWYTNAVLWAAEKGILKGYGNGKLGPEDEVTREQIVNILYQYAVFKGYNTSATANLSSYNDTAKVSDWASTAMQWAVKEGLINGKNNQLDPSSTATRAEIAAIIYRFIEKY